MRINNLLRKSRALVLKGPATARNIVFSQFDYWPIRRLCSDQIRKLPIYCVSMTTATRRRHIIERQVRKMDLTAFAFVDAIAAIDLDRAQLEKRGLYNDTLSNRYHRRSLSLSEIAGSLSHGRVYDIIVSRGHEISMVIEDDCLFIPSRLDRIDLDALPKGWDVVFLNSFIENGRPRRRISGSLYHGDAYTGSAAAYLVSRMGAQRLAAGYKPVFNAADGYVGRNDITRLMYYPDCVLNGSVCHYYRSTVIAKSANTSQ
jgi:GR25 family glycosyltransferase involved in LPS biosynthesis